MCFVVFDVLFQSKGHISRQAKETCFGIWRSFAPSFATTALECRSFDCKSVHLSLRFFTVATCVEINHKT